MQCDGQMARLYFRNMLHSHTMAQPTTTTPDRLASAQCIKRSFNDTDLVAAQGASGESDDVVTIDDPRPAKKICLDLTPLDEHGGTSQTPSGNAPRNSSGECSNAQLENSLAHMRRWREQSDHVRAAIDRLSNVPSTRELPAYQHQLAQHRHKLTGYLASHQMAEAKLDTARETGEAAECELGRRQRCLAALTGRMGLDSQGRPVKAAESDVLESDEMAQHFLGVRNKMVEEYQDYVRESEDDLEQAAAAVSKLEGQMHDYEESISATKSEITRMEYVIEFLQEMRDLEAMAREILTRVNSS